MTRNVSDAAILLGATTGVDPRDPATTPSRSHLPAAGDYRSFLRTDALQGVRLGVQNRSGMNALMQAAITELERQGATIVPIENFNNAKNIGLSEYGSVSNEFKTFINEYLANDANPPTGVKTLLDIILYNQEHSDRVPYGQKWLQISQTQPGTRESTIAGSVATTKSAQALVDDTLQRYSIDAIVNTGAGNFNIGAAAGYPTVITPAGVGSGNNPTSIGFLGTAWSEGMLLGFAYDYEQASLKRVPPTEVNGDELATEACDGGAVVPAPAPSLAALPGLR
jgi:amidase